MNRASIGQRGAVFRRCDVKLVIPKCEGLAESLSSLLLQLLVNIEMAIAQVIEAARVKHLSPHHRRQIFTGDVTMQHQNPIPHPCRFLQGGEQIFAGKAGARDRGQAEVLRQGMVIGIVGQQDMDTESGLIGLDQAPHLGHRQGVIEIQHDENVLGHQHLLAQTDPLFVGGQIGLRPLGHGVIAGDLAQRIEFLDLPRTQFLTADCF